jgi:hypothetical protein
MSVETCASRWPDGAGQSARCTLSSPPNASHALGEERQEWRRGARERRMYQVESAGLDARHVGPGARLGLAGVTLAGSLP